MRVHNQESSDFDACCFALFQLLLQCLDYIFVETTLMICLSGNELHARLIAKVKLKTPIVRLCGQNCLAWCAEGVGQNMVQCSCRSSNLDIIAGDRYMGIEALIDMCRKSCWETWTAGCAVCVSKCITWNVDLRRL